MYSSAWKARNAQPSSTVSASQIFSAPRWPLRKAWWAMVMVTLELTSKIVLISGKPHGLMVPSGAGNILGSGLLSNGQVNWKFGHSMCAMPLCPSPPNQGPDRCRT